MCQGRGITRIQLAPCDVPWMEGDVFKLLRQENRAVVMPRSEQLQPLLSLIEIDAVLDAMDRAKMRDSMKRILRSVPYCIVDFTDPDRFRNVNSQEDLEG